MPVQDLVHSVTLAAHDERAELHIHNTHTLYSI